MKAKSGARRLADLDWYLFTVVAVGVILPYIVHLPGIPGHGMAWFDAYFVGHAFVLNLLPVLTLVVLRGTGPRPGTAFRCAVWFTYGFLGFFHSIVDLSADAMMGVALFTIPVLALPVALIGYVVGLAAERLGKSRGA